eukprot:scaffold103674_cov18-Tisochrysis_lutea.AAC.4
MNLTGVPPFPTTWVKEDMLGSMLFCGVVQSKCVSKDTIGLTIGFKPASYGGRVRQPAGQVAAPAFTRGAGFCREQCKHALQMRSTGSLCGGGNGVVTCWVCALALAMQQALAHHCLALIHACQAL